MSSIDSSIDACYGEYRKIEDMEGMAADFVESFILGRGKSVHSYMNKRHGYVI